MDTLELVRRLAEKGMAQLAEEAAPKPSVTEAQVNRDKWLNFELQIKRLFPKFISDFMQPLAANYEAVSIEEGWPTTAKKAPVFIKIDSMASIRIMLEKREGKWRVGPDEPITVACWMEPVRGKANFQFCEQSRRFGMAQIVLALGEAKRQWKLYEDRQGKPLMEPEYIPLDEPIPDQMGC